MGRGRCAKKCNIEKNSCIFWRWVIFWHFSHVFTCVFDTNVGIKNVSENVRKIQNVSETKHNVMRPLVVPRDEGPSPFVNTIHLVSIGSKKAQLDVFCCNVLFYVCFVLGYNDDISHSEQ